MSEPLLDAAKNGDERAFRDLVAPFRGELRAHCYRMAGSLSDADDLLQESLLRAWRGLAGFEGRSSVRTWLYRVTHSACVDALEKRSPRMLPLDAGPPANPSDPIPPPRTEPVWLEPCPASVYADLPQSPEARYSARESVTLAFLAALQLLPPRQRAVLVARDVLGFSAEECADTFDASVASVNSALQRARETLEARSGKWKPRVSDDDDATRALVARYVEAWERADASLLVALLHDDATLSMPPMPLWLRGARDIAQSIGAMVFARTTPGALRLAPTIANGAPALVMRRDGAIESLHVLGIEGDRIARVDAFLDPRTFASIV
jgi:RNA polymerase sigma-70 factor (ECF subfamily)